MIATYCRVSSDEQARNETIKTQVQEIARYAAAHKIELHRNYADEGITGTIPLERRPFGRQLLEDAKGGLLNELLIYKLDRLGRDTLHTLSAIAQLKKYGVKVTSVTQPSTDDSSGRLMTEILSAFGSFERNNIVERSVAGSRRLAEQGTWMGGNVPFGYRKIGNDKDSRITPSTEPIPGHKLSEVDVVHRIFRMSAEGKTCQQIVDDLNRLGIPVPRFHLGHRERWVRERIRRIIINATYKGVLEYGKRKTTRSEDGTRRLKPVPRENWTISQCPAIVDEKLWDLANAALKRNQLQQMAHPKHEYLLSSLIECSVCHRNYIGVGPRYRCNGRQGATALGTEKCPGQSVRRAELEAAVWDDLRGFLKQPGLVVQELRRKLATTDGGRKAVRAEITELERAHAKTNQMETDNLQHLTERLITKPQFLAERERITKRRADIEQQLTLLRKSLADTEANVRVLHGAQSLIESLREKTDRHPPFAVRRQIAEALVDRVQVDSVEGQTVPKITVTYRFDPHYSRYVNEGRELDRSVTRGPARGVLGD